MGLNEFRSQKLTWNRANNQIFEKIYGNAGDSNGRKLVVQVINDATTENLSGNILSLAWRSKTSEGLDAFSEIDAKKGMFEIYYTTEMLSNVGTLDASLVLVSDSSRLESRSFSIQVEKSVVDDDVVQSDNSFTALTQALAMVTEYQSAIDDKVDKVSGKELSTNDYTTEEKNKLGGIQAGAQVNTVTSVAGKTGAVTVNKSDVGLSNVDNIKQATKTEHDALDARVTSQLADKANRVYVDDKLSRIGSAKPSGAFPTLSDLDIAYPDGDGENYYVVTEDNNWYYWSGSAWSKGGLFNATVSSEFPATNVVVNGDFSKGTESWFPYDGTISVVGGELVYTVVTLAPSSRIDQNPTLPDIAIPGHVYYVRGDIFPKFATDTRLQFGGVFSPYASVIPNQWNKVSSLITPTESARLRFYHITTTKYVVGDTIKFDNVMAVDLTATFGAGKEPTLEEFESMLDGYINGWFDGTVSPLVGTKKIYTQTRDQQQRLGVMENQLKELTGLSTITTLSADPVSPPIGAMWMIVDTLEVVELEQSVMKNNYAIQPKATRIVAQKFVASKNFDLGLIGLFLNHNIGIMPSITCEIWESASLNDTAPTKLITSLTITDNDYPEEIANNYVWIKKKLTSPISVISGKTYWIVLYTQSGNILIGTGDSASLSNASMGFSTNEGLSYATLSSSFVFRLSSLQEVV